MKKNGNDPHQLALDADKQADAALRQIEKLAASVKEAHSLALSAQAANKNAIEADRPWMGSGIGVQNFEAGKATHLYYDLLQYRPQTCKDHVGTESNRILYQVSCRTALRPRIGYKHQSGCSGTNRGQYLERPRRGF
jgi:hypothetical protein